MFEKHERSSLLLKAQAVWRLKPFEGSSRLKAQAVWRLKPLSPKICIGWLSADSHVSHWVSTACRSTHLLADCWAIVNDPWPTVTDWQSNVNTRTTDAWPTIGRLSVNSSVDSQSTVSWQLTNTTYITHDPDNMRVDVLRHGKVVWSFISERNVIISVGLSFRKDPLILLRK